MIWHYKEYSAQIYERIILGDCKAESMITDLVILRTYIKILSCVKLCEYDSDGKLICYNCLSVSELQSIVAFLNKFFNLKYCVTFIKD